MSRSNRVLWLANLVLFVTVPGAFGAQDLPSGATIRLTSRLVYVDVVVRDRSGQVFRDLTQQNFRIEEDGTDPKYIPPYERIAALEALQKQWQDVVSATRTALQLDPAGTPQIWYFSAVGNFNLGNADVAETAAKTSMSMDPSHMAPNTEQLLAVILAAKGAFSEALDHLRHCLTYTPPGPNADLMKQQIAQLEKLVPKTAK